MSSRKVNFQETVFEFGDDLNDLNSLEMQVSYQEIELRVRFANKAQLMRWKSTMLAMLGRAEVMKELPQAGHARRATTFTRKALADVKEENVEPDMGGEYDASIEMSNQKPIMFHRFNTKSKGNLEQDAFMREQRLTITRALSQSILKRRQGDDMMLPESGSQVNLINNMNVSASGSFVEEDSSVNSLNLLVEKIKNATSNIAEESGDIGCESEQRTLSKQL